MNSRFEEVKMSGFEKKKENVRIKLFRLKDLE